MKINKSGRASMVEVVSEKDCTPGVLGQIAVSDGFLFFSQKEGQREPERMEKNRCQTLQSKLIQTPTYLTHHI